MTLLPIQFKTLTLFICLSFLLTACGGSSSSSVKNSPPPSPDGGLLPAATGETVASAPQTQYQGFKDSDTFANQCVAPRPGIDPATGKAFPDRKGSSELEKLWLRSISHETYLWPDEIVDIDFTNLSVLDYFMALRTPAKTSSGRKKDPFHFYENSADEYQQFVLGKNIGYGIEWRVFGQDFSVVYVQPGSPADKAGITRGMVLKGVDKQTLANLTATVVNAVLFDAAENSQHSIELLNPKLNVTESFALTAVEIQEQPVFPIKTLTGLKGEKVGYLGFHSFNGPSEQALLNAVQTLKNDQVNELIVDLRYNGGGYIAVASELAYMLAGKQKTQNKIFSRTRYNAAIEAAVIASGDSLDDGFLNQTQGLSQNLSKGTVLPELNLQRLYVLTGANSCSASELLINALRGIDLPVIQIGETTCGKPYGFFNLQNCGYKYYTINFQTQNAKGFGDYSDGMSPRDAATNQGSPAGCVVSDDIQHLLGDSDEKRLAAALQHIATGQCSDAQTASIKGVLPIGLAPSVPNYGPQHAPVWSTNMIINR